MRLLLRQHKGIVKLRMLNVVMLNAIMMNVTMLNVATLNVVASQKMCLMGFNRNKLRPITLII